MLPHGQAELFTHIFHKEFRLHLGSAVIMCLSDEEFIILREKIWQERRRQWIHRWYFSGMR